MIRYMTLVLLAASASIIVAVPGIVSLRWFQAHWHFSSWDLRFGACFMFVTTGLWAMTSEKRTGGLHRFIVIWGVLVFQVMIVVFLAGIGMSGIWKDALMQLASVDAICVVVTLLILPLLDEATLQYQRRARALEESILEDPHAFFLHPNGTLVRTKHKTRFSLWPLPGFQPVRLERRAIDWASAVPCIVSQLWGERRGALLKR